MPTSAAAVRTCRFGPLTVEHDARVLAPRAWTLAQSVWAAELAREATGDRCAPLLEVCAGAGHIGLAAAVLADRDLVQIELDPVASAYAVRNARRAGWGDRVEIRVGPLQTALRPGETFGLIVADPPYLASSAIGCWPEDPVQAIDGGQDGLDLIRPCLRLAGRHLDRGGHLLLQVAGPAQAAEVSRLLRAAPGWSLRAAQLQVTDAERAILRVDRTD
jgi:release factor glutamine methyltransferase